MDKPSHHDDASCKLDAAVVSAYRKKLPKVAERIISNCDDQQCFTHIDYEPIPSEGYVVDIIAKMIMEKAAAYPKRK